MANKIGTIDFAVPKHTSRGCSLTNLMISKKTHQVYLRHT